MTSGLTGPSWEFQPSPRSRTRSVAEEPRPPVGSVRSGSIPGSDPNRRQTFLRSGAKRGATQREAKYSSDKNKEPNEELQREDEEVWWRSAGSCWDWRPNRAEPNRTGIKQADRSFLTASSGCSSIRKTQRNTWTQPLWLLLIIKSWKHSKNITENEK